MDRTREEGVNAQLAEISDDLYRIMEDLSKGKIDSKQARAAREPLRKKLQDIHHTIRSGR